MTEPESESLALMPFVDARRSFPARELRFRLLRPSYPAVGLGSLRVLRVRDIEGTTEVVAGYDGYARVTDLLQSPERT